MGWGRSPIVRQPDSPAGLADKNRFFSFLRNDILKNLSSENRFQVGWLRPKRFVPKTIETELQTILVFTFLGRFGGPIPLPTRLRKSTIFYRVS